VFIKGLGGRFNVPAFLYFFFCLCLQEVGESYFLDKEYLKNYDLVDIPGVSEYKGNENDNLDDLVYFQK